jgi:cellulose synthase/poly-beta-1,6-N-acetylglucosamine synthase-like glycosyltransferase
VFEQDAIERLVGSLYEHEAGAVVGELQLQNSAGDNQDSLYWRVERMLKAAEGRLGGLLGANGAIYAIRSELYEPLPPDTIIDDFVIAMRIASRGHALVYESAARAIEDTPDNIEDEFRRRVRIGIGNYQALFRFPQFLFKSSPQRGLCYLSHKILRWLGPHLLLVMLIASLLSYEQPLYRALFWAQLLGYGMLLGVNAVRARVRLPRWLSGLLLLAGLNLAFAVAFWRYLCNDTQGQWSRTQRRVSH